MDAESLPSNSSHSWGRPKDSGRSDGRCSWEGQASVGTAEHEMSRNEGSWASQQGIGLQGLCLKDP